ncbi:MAG: hypothetical protein ACYDH2_04395, partial [Anaerolineaceae bacterium]
MFNPSSTNAMRTPSVGVGLREFCAPSVFCKWGDPPLPRPLRFVHKNKKRITHQKRDFEIKIFVFFVSDFFLETKTNRPSKTAILRSKRHVPEHNEGYSFSLRELCVPHDPRSLRASGANGVSISRFMRPRAVFARGVIETKTNP